MTKKVDIIDVMLAVNNGELKVAVHNGFFTLEHTKSGERVRLNEADAVPVVHGRWIVNVEFNNGEKIHATCSHCKTRGEVRTDRNEWGIWHINSPYCPNCGAHMDLK